MMENLKQVIRTVVIHKDGTYTKGNVMARVALEEMAYVVLEALRKDDSWDYILEKEDQF